MNVTPEDQELARVACRFRQKPQTTNTGIWHVSQRNANSSKGSKVFAAVHCPQEKKEGGRAAVDKDLPNLVRFQEGRKQICKWSRQRQ